MASRPEVAVRHPKRMRVEDLERHSAALLARAGGPRPALLSVSLLRDDRMRALARRDDAFEVLTAVLDRVEQALRPGDRFAVVAIDELWVTLADAPSEAIVRLAATALRDAVDGHYDARLDDGTPYRVGVSAAIAGAWVDQPPGDLFSLSSTLGRAGADARSAEGRIALRSASGDRRSARIRLAARVREALEANELEIWYQPQVRLSDRSCPSLEALVRWPQPAGAPPVSPATIVSICEENGLVGELTRFCVNTVLRNQMTWAAAGFEPQVGINLSALTLADASFPSQVAQACDTWGVPPTRLLFELTESSIARNERATLDFMHRLRELGCELSIDDFGTGYSSFAYLRQFPVNELKIDRAFVTDLATEAADRRIVKVLIEIAHAFGLRALAEGVEDAEGVRVLESLGCDLVQGWHFAKAMPAGEIRGWVSALADGARPAGTLQTA
jgi:EAL domain-containing protein (putative c-di-GMP-specific phosphodiesterase class I)